MTDEEFFEFCSENPELRIERDAEGEVTIMSPAGGYSSGGDFDLAVDFGLWIRRNKQGKGFDSSAGFVLPNGAIRSPDFAWVRLERLNSLAKEVKRRFIPLAPDLVVELRSPMDSLMLLKEKMEECIDNGVRLGWLVDPQNRDVWIYRPNSTPKRLHKPIHLTGTPDFPDLEIPLDHIWEPNW